MIRKGRELGTFFSKRRSLSATKKPHNTALRKELALLEGMMNTTGQKFGARTVQVDDQVVKLIISKNGPHDLRITKVLGSLTEEVRTGLFSGYNTDYQTGTFTGKTEDGSFYLATFCPDSYEVLTDSTPKGLCEAGCAKPGLYSGRMRTIVQRMNGAGHTVPWPFLWTDSCWIYTATNEDEYVIRANADGVQAGKITYDDGLEHVCGSETIKVPTGNEDFFQIASALELEDYFEQNSLYAFCGWAANSAGDAADNLSWYVSTDGYVQIVHWRISVSEVNNIPDSASLSQISEDLAWSASRLGSPIYPLGHTRTFMFEMHYTDVEPAGYPNDFPIHVFYDDDDIVVVTQVETEAESPTTVDEEPPGGYNNISGKVIVARPEDYHEYVHGTKTVRGSKSYSGPGIPSAGAGYTSTGDVRTWYNPIIAEGWIVGGAQISGTGLVEGSASLIYRLFDSNVDMTVSYRTGICVPNGDREAILTFIRKTVTKGPHNLFYTNYIHAAAGDQHLTDHDLQNNPCWCADAPVAYSLPACTGKTDEGIWSGSDGEYRTGAQFRVYKVGVADPEGYDVYCADQILFDIPFPYPSGTGMSSPGDTSGDTEITLVASGGISDIVWSGDYDEGQNDWISLSEEYPGNTLVITRLAEGDGMVVPIFNGSAANNGVVVGDLLAEYQEALEDRGMYGSWVGKPQ